MKPLLSVQNLKTFFFTGSGLVKAVDGISFDVAAGETLALVGESGCGKSVTALSLLRLIPEPGRITEGRIFFEGEDLLQLPPSEMRRIRGNRIAMIFQEPMSSLNPVLKIGEQVAEVLRLHKGSSGEKARDKVIELLRQVGIPSPAQRLDEYPHQLSGGLRQRVMIAIALACNPALLIADEPTTALDVTIQAQILELLRELQASREMTTLLISHDLGVVAESAQRVAIMYAGQIVESASVDQLFNNPQHPYTRGLLDSVPRLGQKHRRLRPVSGQVPPPGQVPSGCAFRDRCPDSSSECTHSQHELLEIGAGHHVRCWRCQ